jgi:hypothetical protein
MVANDNCPIFEAWADGNRQAISTANIHSVNFYYLIIKRSISRLIIITT